MPTLDTAPSTLRIETARVFKPFLQPSRYKGAYGGRGSAKSHEFAKNLVIRALDHEGLRAVCVREVQKSLEQSVKRLIEDKIAIYDIGHAFRVLDTHIETPGDGIIIFQGMQAHTAESVKSLEGYDIAWVEEAQSLSQKSLDLLRPTIRKPGSELWFSWNPRYPTDPVDDFFRGRAERKEGQGRWVPPPDAITIESNYADNPWFPDVLRDEMEWDLRRDPDKYKHVWGGGYELRSEARVFNNWRVEFFDAPPSNTVFYFGGDWGYSVDPTVLIRLFCVQPKAGEGRGTLYIDQEVYKIGCEIDHTPALFDTMENGMARNWTIIADSARPETISYLKRHGYSKIEPAIKGANSIKEGVIFLQGYDIIIHPRCVHTIDEFTMYSYKVDKQTGNITPILEDKKNHVIDSVRYAVERIRKPQQWATW